ncbi:fumarylacetoacetate hydrolase family protein [Amaricoccus sp. W119]|uniref:fumarylacetoacetate hydrolase family protein n=1 Tax=Amaricoccus sp. W119 TaxID=3391833 RepID=UPI0039A676BF
MKLVSFSRPGGPIAAGVLDGESVAGLTEVGLAESVIEVIREGQPALERIRAGLAHAPRHALANVRLEVPLRPGKVLCSGINYRGHARENPNAKMPDEPFFFAKLPSSVVGPDVPVAKPARTEQVDYEVEFAVVIGAPLHRATEAAVMPAIFGYTLLNDISARDVQFKDSQITIGKNFAGFAPIGPCVLTADAMPRPDRVALRTRLNGRTLQDGNTSDWLFSLPRLISFLSEHVPLEPGDIVTTGTPAGVGVFRDPQVFMWPGDVVEIEAEGIGILRTPISET